MAEITLKTRLVLRNNTLQNWNANGATILLKGEPIIVWDNNIPKLKFGDGTRAVSDLPFAYLTPTEVSNLIDTKTGNLKWVKNVTISGTGNGIASATYDNTDGTLDLTRGNFLTAHQDISGKVDKINTTAKASGLYKIAYNAQGQITSSAAVSKSDITALGIPGSDTNTTYTLSGKAVTNGGAVVLTPNSGNASEVSILGSGATTVSYADGKITISSTNTDTNTTYTFAEGTTNGAFSVTPSDSGTAQSVKIHGLGSAAYTASSAYATATQGTLATNAMPKAGGTFTGAPIWETAPTEDGHLVNKKYVDNSIASKISSILKFKGTKETVADLPATGNTVGDVWHVKATHGEYVWATVDGATTPSWESLGEVVDLSGYTLKDDLKRLIFKSGDTSFAYSPLTEKNFTFTAGSNVNLTLSDTGLTIAATNTDTKVSNVANSTGKVFTGITTSGTTSTVSTTEVGKLVLTGFAASTSDTGAITATDTLTKALNKIYNLANSKSSSSGTVTSIIAGSGLSGGTITTSGTISHGAKPAADDGEVLTTTSGTGLSFLTEISIDGFGHIATAKKATVSAGNLGALTAITAGPGIVVDSKSGTTQKVSLDTSVTYILDGNVD